MEELVLGMALAMPEDTTANCWWVVFFWQFVAKKMCLSHGSRLILNRVDISPMVAAGLVAKEAPSLDDLEREAEQLAFWVELLEELWACFSACAGDPRTAWYIVHGSPDPDADYDLPGVASAT
jgi:hypothetical protein